MSKLQPWRVQRDFQRNDFGGEAGRGTVVAFGPNGKRALLSVSKVPGACGSHFISNLDELTLVPRGIAKRMVQAARRSAETPNKVMLICTTSHQQTDARTRLEELGFIASPEGTNANSGNGVMAHVKVF